MDELTSIGQFKNKHGELFVVLVMRKSREYYITGDETGWEPVKVGVSDFILTPQETGEMMKVIGEYLERSNAIKH